jgi:alpha-D-ribose 1-methylphosphonate 5-triphosphate synthase subunit PhnG
MRQKLLSTLAIATLEELEAGLAQLPHTPQWARLRGPDAGMIMVRGRIGGGGSPFNLGEATVVRASVKLSSNHVGHGYCLGTSMRKAELIAVFDALGQAGGQQEILDGLQHTIHTRVEALRQQDAAEAAATRVDFFTLVRGED